MTPDVMWNQHWADLTAWLGADREREAHSGENSEVPSGRDVVAERLAYARGEGPEPEADPIPPNHPLLGMAGFMVPPPQVTEDADSPS